MVCLTGGSFTGLIPQIPTITPPNVSSCLPDVLGLIQGGNAFQNPLTGPITDCISELGSIFGVEGFTSGPEFDAVTSIANAFTVGQETTPGVPATFVPGLLTHTDNLADAAPALLTQGSSLINGSVMMGSAGLNSVPSNPCELLDSIMGTILGAANDIINVLAELIGPIVEAIIGGLVAVLGAIALVIGAIAEAVAALLGVIADEIAALAKFLADFLDFSIANSLVGIASDPCLQAILNALGTPDLINCLVSGVPNFNVF